MNKRFAVLILVVALTALAAGCSETANSNASNTATVVNNNGNKNTSGVTTTNGNTTGNANANANSRSYNANISKEEYEKEKERYGKDAEGYGDKIGKGLLDGYYWVKVKGALALVDDLRDSTINVDIDNAVVTLRGTVASKEQADKALKAAKVDGVKSVTSQLKVAADSGNTNSNKNATTGAAKK